MHDDRENLRLVTPHNGVIPGWVLSSVRKDAERVVPTLDRGRAYRADAICAGIWKRLSTHEHKDAGRALKFLANNGMVGLRCVGMDSSHHALYVRTD
jgi:hypothetical protein